MEYRWQNRNLDVKDVVAKAEQFLRDRGFTISVSGSGNTVKVAGVRRREKYDARLVEIVISGSPKELSIKFEAGDHMKPLLQLSSLISFWGGGSAILKELKTTEYYRKIEDEFWREMEKIVSG